MHYPELVERADFFKHKKEWINTMCKIMQALQDERRAEGQLEMATNTALDMLRDHEPMEKIIKYSRLSEERIKELAL